MTECFGVSRHINPCALFCRLPEKGIKETVKEMKEKGQGRKRKMNESEETEEIKTFPLYPYLLQE